MDPAIGYDPSYQRQKQKRVILLGAGVVGFFVVLSLIAALIGGDSGGLSSLGQVSARNSEILRVIELQEKNIQSSSLQTRVANTKTLLSNSTASLKGLGITADKKQIQAVHQTEIDTTLESAFKTNRLEEELTAYLDKQITLSVEVLQDVLSNLEDGATKTLLVQELMNLQSLQ
jgi:hypothetical protein